MRLVKEERMLRPGEVARMLDVHPRTPVRWAQTGKLPEGSFFRTPSGVYMFKESWILKLVGEGGMDDSVVDETNESG